MVASVQSAAAELGRAPTMVRSTEAGRRPARARRATSSRSSRAVDAASPRRPRDSGRYRAARPHPATRHTPHGAPRPRPSGRGAEAPPRSRVPPSRRPSRSRTGGRRYPRRRGSGGPAGRASERTRSRSEGQGDLEVGRLPGHGDRTGTPCRARISASSVNRSGPPARASNACVSSDVVRPAASGPASAVARRCR